MEKPKPQRHALGGRDPERLAPRSFAGRVHRLRRLLIPRFDEPCAEESYRRFAGRESAAAWSKCSLSSAPARLQRLPRAHLAALGSSVLPGGGHPTGRPATASGARASRLYKAASTAYDHQAGPLTLTLT